MTHRQGRPFQFFKTITRPLLFPILVKLGLREPDATKVSRKDRVPIAEVPSVVTVRDDRTILLNGSPFFPIGLYYAQDEIADPTGAGLRHLRKLGFNTIAFRADQSTEELDRIADAGLYVWYRPAAGLHADYHRLKAVVAEYARHPALLFWEHDDEPIFNKVSFSQAEIGRGIVRAMDPHHPILCTQWMSKPELAEEIIEWGRLADVYGFSQYPIPYWRWEKRMGLVESGWPHSITIVGKQTDVWRSFVPRKPVIPVLQAWAWNCLEDGEAGFPTYAEARFMAYQAVIHGANGIHYYGAFDVTTPNFTCGLPPAKEYEDVEKIHTDFLEARARNQQFWSYFSLVISELSRMSEVFVGRDAEWTPVIQNKSGENQLEFRAKRYGDSTVTLIVNASAAAAQFEVQAIELSDKLLRVWGDDRTIQVNSEGKFQDTLEPFGVGIYSDQTDLLAGLTIRQTQETKDGRFDCPSAAKV